MAAHALTHFICEVTIGDADKEVGIKARVGDTVRTEDDAHHAIVISITERFAVFPVIAQVVVQSGPDLVLDANHTVRALDQDVDTLVAIRAGLPFDALGGLDTLEVQTFHRPAGRATRANFSWPVAD